MDFNSGSLPLEFIRFYLDMASEEQITESTLPTTEGSEVTRETGDASKNPVVTPVLIPISQLAAATLRKV